MRDVRAIRPQSRAIRRCAPTIRPGSEGADVTAVTADPVGAAARWVDEGAEWMRRGRRDTDEACVSRFAEFAVQPYRNRDPDTAGKVERAIRALSQPSSRPAKLCVTVWFRIAEAHARACESRREALRIELEALEREGADVAARVVRAVAGAGLEDGPRDPPAREAGT